LPIYGNGSAVRDYIYVDDHAAGIARVLWKGDPGRVYNLGAGHEVSGVQVADAVLDHCARPKSLKHFVKDRPGHDYRYALDTRRVRTLGWEQQVDFRRGIELTRPPEPTQDDVCRTRK